MNGTVIGRMIPVLLIVVVAGLSAHTRVAQAQAEVQGTIRHGATDRPLPGVIVTVEGTLLSTRTDTAGQYQLCGVLPGLRQIRARAIGFRAAEVTVTAQEGAVHRADLILYPVATSLADIVVTPGRSALRGRAIQSQATLSTEDLAVLPQLGEDLYRAITRLPGMASSEYTARFWLRGAPEQELLVRLDGVDLVEPFHLKDFDGALSIIDATTIGRLDLTSGGFTSEYGDRLTGVLDMETVHPSAERTRHSIGLSVASVRLASQGGVRNGRGEWLVAARRGYLDLGLKLIGNDIQLSPRYYDVSAKVASRLGTAHRVSLHLLRAGDAVDFTDDFGRILESRYGSTFVWGTWEAQVEDAIHARTVVALSRLAWNRHGDARSIPLDYLIDDIRSARTLSLRQDWEAGAGERVLLKGGFELKSLAGRYDYQADQAVAPPRDIQLSPSGHALGAYLAFRTRPLRPVTIEIGARGDRQSYVDEASVAPRLNAAMEIAPGAMIRAAWGAYSQAPGIHQIQVQNGDEAFRPAERATQLAAGLERVFASGVVLKLEGYDRRYSHLNPLQVNLGNGSAVFPEAESDRRSFPRSGGRARGVEVLVQRREGRRLDWAGSYAYAEAADHLEGEAGSVPRARDQRHTLYLDLAYTPGPLWTVSLAWQAHSGWPYTARSTSGLPGFEEFNGERLPTYHRLDARITRQVAVRRGALRLYLDIFNLYNRANPRGYSYGEDEDGLTRVVADNQLPFLPTIGLNWDF